MHLYFKIHIFITILALTACDSSDPSPQINCAQTGPSLSITSTASSTCVSADGTITAQVKSQDEGLVYTLDGGEEQKNGVFEGLIAGVYTVEVTNLDGCKDSEQVTIAPETSTTNISDITVNSDAGCQSTSGSISISATGAGAILYSVSTTNKDNFQSNGTINNLAAGRYNVAVKDENGCVDRSSVIVLNGTSYANEVNNIIQSNCAISDCHNGDDTSIPNWTIFTNVQSRASAIKSRTQSGSMPPEGQPDLTDTEKALIACWVDDGAMNN